MTTMKTNTASRVADALRARFSGRVGARAALRALGLDGGDLLGPAPAAGKSGNGLRTFRVALEQAMSQMDDLPETAVSKILELLDEHAPMDRLPDDHPNKQRAAALAGDDEDANEEHRERFRKLLVARGLDDDDARREALQVYPRPARDREMPRSASRGGMGGRLSDLHEQREIAQDGAVVEIETAMARISSPPAYGPERKRSAGARGEADLLRMYGDDLGRIVTHA